MNQPRTVPWIVADFFNSDESMLPHGGVKKSGWVRDPFSNSTLSYSLTADLGPIQRSMGDGGILEAQDCYLHGVKFDELKRLSRTFDHLSHGSLRIAGRRLTVGKARQNKESTVYCGTAFLNHINEASSFNLAEKHQSGATLFILHLRRWQHIERCGDFLLPLHLVLAVDLGTNS